MKIIAVVIGLVFCSSAYSTNPSDLSVWQDELYEPQLRSKGFSTSVPIKQRRLSLNENGLKGLLAKENHSISLRSKVLSPELIEIDLPLPNGSFERVKVSESSVLSAEVTAQYPNIKTWQVVGVDNPAISGSIDFTSKGFHGMLVMPDGDIVYIDPAYDDTSNDSTKLYNSMSKAENSAHFKTHFNCEVHDNHTTHDTKKLTLAGKTLSERPVQDLITYKLALAGTAEYATAHGGSAGAYASMITTINRVNEIYRRDLGIKLQLVSGESLIYSDESTDPYSNSSASSMVAENIANLNDNFGANNYDIGHVFSKGLAGGLAYAGAVCQTNYKAGGVTGTPSPQGEVFNIEYVAHEMGHQLGASHTFNSQLSACGSGRVQSTAVEPGSGSTIMGYAGLCSNDNLQNNSDAVFHWASINQINNYTRSQTGSSCGVRTASAVQNIEADAGSDITIPANTPFMLDGIASDGEGLTYSWDQIDAGTASLVDEDIGDNAIIRSLLPVSDPDRYLPSLNELFTAVDTFDAKLPTTTRELNFAHVVRGTDGSISTDFKKVSVVNTGSTFEVLSQVSSKILSLEEAIDVEWNVAGTDASPINCQTVNINLLRSNGVINSIKENTANDGFEQVIIPLTTPAMTNARIMVGCSDSSFFQVSSGSIAINIEASIDPLAPVIMINGSDLIDIAKDTEFADPGATAVDSSGTDIEVTVTGEVDTSVVGEYAIIYSAMDSVGKISTEKRIINVTEENIANKVSEESSAGGIFNSSILLFLLMIFGIKMACKFLKLRNLL